MKPWTEPGPDMIHIYWVKKLTAFHEHIAAQINQLLIEGLQPEWLTQGWIIMIMKTHQKGSI